MYICYYWKVPWAGSTGPFLYTVVPENNARQTPRFLPLHVCWKLTLWGRWMCVFPLLSPMWGVPCLASHSWKKWKIIQNLEQWDVLTKKESGLQSPRKVLPTHLGSNTWKNIKIDSSFKQQISLCLDWLQVQLSLFPSHYDFVPEHLNETFKISPRN